MPAQLLRDLAGLGVLLPLASYSVTHFGEKRLPRGAKRFWGNGFVRDASGDPAVLSFFSDPRDPSDRWRYVLVVNRSPNRASKTRLTVSGTVKGVERFDPSIGETGAFVAQPLGGKPSRFLYPSPRAGRAVLYRMRKA